MFGLLKDVSFPQQPPIYHQALIYRLGISGDNNKIWRRKNLPFFGRKWGVECCYHHQHFAALPLMTDHGNLDLHGIHPSFWANRRETIFKLKFLKSGLKYKWASFIIGKYGILSFLWLWFHFNRFYCSKNGSGWRKAFSKVELTSKAK